MADVFEDRRDLDELRNQLFKMIEDTQHLDWLLLTKRPEMAAHLVPWTGDWPSNVWLGVTAEDQESANTRLGSLATIPALVRFISAEPLLGPLDVGRWLGSTIRWVIAGGESGRGARPSSPSWFRSLLAQCEAADVPFHFKQWGDWVPRSSTVPSTRQAIEAADGTVMLRVGKKVAGRMLDGVVWDGFPRMAAA